MPDRPTSPVTPPGTTPCRVLLRTIRTALNTPYPAGEADKDPYLILRSKRASLAAEACDRVLADPDADGDDMLISAAALTRQLADYPASTYRHSGLPM
jgi:hypothetical protein